MPRALTLLILGSAAAILLVSPVVGHDERIDSRVVIKGAAGGIYVGKVISSDEDCEFDRRVIVFHDSRPDFRIGADTTNDRGRWRVKGLEPERGEKIFAIVKREQFQNNSRHDHACVRDVSPRVIYPHLAGGD